MMLRSLRNRLILSHILPSLVIIPLLGIALIYTLESQVLLPGLSRELAGDARLLAEMAKGQTEIWDDPAYARQILSQAHPELDARVMLVTPDGRLLASSDANDQSRIGQALDVDGLDEALQGAMIVRTNYSQGMQAEIVDVFAPVLEPDGRVVGVVRMSHRYNTIIQEFLRLRYLIFTILILGLVGGVFLGSGIAISISQPLQRVTRAVYDLARGSRKEALSIQGPEEIQQVLRSVNYLVERLHNLEESRQRLLANLIHELGRPLGAIHSALQALLLGSKNDPVILDELLTGIDDETRRMDHLLEELSHLHDQVLGVLELDLEPVALQTWLLRILSPWREAALAKGLDWQVAIPDDLPEREIDPVRLGQALGNLLSNAIKFTPPGGRVSITAGSHQEGDWIRVGNTGPGIPAEEQEKIFVPFYRGAQGGRVPKGMGLGLSIAKDLVVAHGGWIEVQSEPDQETAFTIWLPSNPSI